MTTRIYENCSNSCAMENETNWEERADAYIRGKLSEEEVIAFEKDLDGNPGRRESIRIKRLEHEAIELLIEDDLRQKMASWNTPQPATGILGSSPWRWAMGLASAAVVLIALLIWWQRQPGVKPTPESQVAEKSKEKGNESGQDPGDTLLQPAPTKDELPAIKPGTPGSITPDKYLAVADAFYETPPSPFADSKGAGTTPPQDALSLGIQAVLDHRPQEAIRLLEQVDTAAVPDKVRFYKEWKAYAYYEIGRYSAAAALLRSLAADKNNSVASQDRYEWYLLLSLVPDYARNQAEVKALLDKMTDPAIGHEYSSRALQLKKALIP